MSQCIVDVKFLYNEKNYVYAEKILICGITLQGKSFVKEICYSYPTKKVEKYCDSVDETDDAAVAAGNINKTNLKFGNLEYHKTDLELTRTLNKFNFILVKGKLEKEFLNYYNVNEAKILEISTLEE